MWAVMKLYKTLDVSFGPLLQQSVQCSGIAEGCEGVMIVCKTKKQAKKLAGKNADVVHISLGRKTA